LSTSVWDGEGCIWSEEERGEGEGGVVCREVGRKEGGERGGGRVRGGGGGG